MESIKDEIIELIESKAEGDYWDFKEFHYENKANLVHDIICMANNRADRDAYIIFGVRDNDYSVVGVENDVTRRNQQQMIDQLKDKKFAGGIRPTVYLKTIIIDGHEIDILIIKNSTDTPYYLEEKFQDKARVVNAHHIYTRVGDTNTDINKNADIDKIEYLWKKRFLLNKSPLDQIIKKLQNKEEWVSEDCSYYNKYNPEYTITLVDDYDSRNANEYYSYAMCNESTSYGMVEIKSYGTKLYSNQYAVLDSGRYITSVPRWEFISFDKYHRDSKYSFKYFLKSDIEYKIHRFLFDDTSEEAVSANRRFMKVVVVFKNKDEKDMFMKYLNINRMKFEESVASLEKNYGHISCYNEQEKENVITILCTNIVINNMVKEFRSI